MNTDEYKQNITHRVFLPDLKPEVNVGINELYTIYFIINMSKEDIDSLKLKIKCYTGQYVHGKKALY